MAAREGASAAYLEKASPRFGEAFESVELAVRRIFPRAEPIFAYRMPGWRVPVPAKSVPKGPRGTLPADALFVLLADRKAGVTLHVWNPADYFTLDHAKGELSEAGFKVMRGCLQFNRKAPYPVAAVETLLRGIRASWTAR